jgi:hypothetical protein
MEDPVASKHKIEHEGAEGTRRIIGQLEGCKITEIHEFGVIRIEWTANMTIDCDGMPVNTYNDPYWQSETSLKYHGQSINADKVPYIVVPPMIVKGTRPIVMGCQATVVNYRNGLCTPAVVADGGPSTKIGEASCECAGRVGLERNPNYGGTMEDIILYICWPGIPAKVDGVTYKLQAS